MEDRSVARAIDALRRGWPVSVDGLAVLAVEAADANRLLAFAPNGTADVLLSGHRAATLKLGNRIDAGGDDVPVHVAHDDRIDLTLGTALADPALDLAYPFKGPFRTIPLADIDAARGALALARLAGLLPALFVGSAQTEDRVSSDAIRAFESPLRLTIASRARLPIQAAETTEIVAYRGHADAAEHVALLIGSPNGAPPLVRLHSECLTGDVLGSLKCDCGPQLDAALREIAAAGWGILLYLRQEGRGIGLVNKLRAYALQDQGYDTVDANLRLGFGVDERDFGVAAQMLLLLGQDRIRLLTNNPSKVAGLEAAGVTVIERVAHALPPNPHNRAYLDTKRDRTGHQL